MNDNEQDLRDELAEPEIQPDDTKAIPDLKAVTAPPQTVNAVPVSENENDENEEAPVAGLDGSTVRLDQLPHLTASFVAAQEAAMDREMEQLEAFAEPEPEEEEPVDEYIPPDRVIEHPRSRMREIKRKLAAGPERRYYQLSERGMGKVQVAMFLTLVLVAVSAGAAALYALGYVSAERMRLMVFGQVLIMLLAALMGCYQLMEGVGDLFIRGRFTLNTLLAVTFIACCCDAVYCLQEQRVPICAAFALEVFMSLWASYHRRTTELGQMDTLRRASRLDGLFRVEDFYDGKPGIVRDVGQVEDFMDFYDELSLPERRQNGYALVSLFISLAISVLAGILHGVPTALLILSTSLLVAVPASFFISVSRPAAVLERKLHRLGTVICGWQGIEGLLGRITVPLSDSDMFPRGTTKMNGVKFYNDFDPDEVIAYAAALFRATGGGLAPLFEDLLLSRAGPRYDVKNLQKYPGGGIGGEIGKDPVLVGSLRFLKDMGVDIPAGTVVNQAVHLSIDGQLAGLFAISYNRSKYAAAGLATLAGDRRIRCVVTAGDFLLDDGFLRSKFGIKTKRVVFPDLRERLALNRIAPEEGEPALVLVTREGLAPAAYAVTGARVLRTACRLGFAIHLIGGVIGMLMMLALALLGSAELLTPLNVLLYQLIWACPGLLVTLWPGTI